MSKVVVGEAEVIRESDKALLVRLDDADEKDTHWIPKSVIHDDSEVYNDRDGSNGTLIVEEWFAKKTDWIDCE